MSFGTEVGQIYETLRARLADTGTNWRHVYKYDAAAPPLRRHRAATAPPAAR